MANPYQPGPPPMPPTGPFDQGPPQGPGPHTLTRGQRFGLGGCGIVVFGCVALVAAALALGPDTVTKVKTVPGPTVTVTVPGTPAPQPSPSSGIPQLGGKSWREAEKQTVRLRAVSAYTDVKLPEDHDGWRVCSQESKPSATGSTVLRLYLAESVCPAVPGTRLHPATASPGPSRSRDGGSSTGGSGTGGSSTGGSDTGGSSAGGSGGGSRVVHPGAFCSPAGATGVTSAGTPMVCGPGSDGRNRWHHA